MSGALPQGRFEQIRKLLWYQEHLDVCIEDVFRCRLEPHQREMAIAASTSDKVAVHTAHGVGKTHLEARLGLAILFVYEGAKVIDTAPSFRQVKDLFWAEVHTAMAQADLGQVFWDAPYQLLKTRLNLSPAVYMTGESSDDPRKMEGYHAPNICFIVDEAKGVEDAVFDAIEGALTSGAASGGRSLRFYASTPGECVGKHFRICTGEDPGWTVVHVSGEGKMRPDPDWVEDKKRTWGEDSFLYRTRVQGLFDPRGGDTVIDQALVDAAFKQRLQPVGLPEVGVDVARQGDDRTVICVRQGPCLLSLVETNGRDVVWVADAVARVAQSLADRFHIPVKRVRIKVDDVGVGGGVTDILRRRGFAVVPIRASELAGDEARYRTRRDEIWFGMQARLKAGDLDLSRCPARLKRELAAELSSPRWSLDQRERFVVEPTEKVKRRLRRSPDLAMGLLYAYAGHRPRGGPVGDVTTHFFKHAGGPHSRPADVPAAADQTRVAAVGGYTFMAAGGRGGRR